MFSPFLSPNGRILIIDVKNNRQNYRVVYVSCFDFGRESGKKKYWTKWQQVSLEFNMQSIYLCKQFWFNGLWPHKKMYYLLLGCDILLHFITIYEQMLRFLRINDISSLLVATKRVLLFFCNQIISTQYIISRNRKGLCSKICRTILDWLKKIMDWMK
jgi:hypothetical protein